MNRLLIKGPRVLFFLSLGIIILWWLYKDQDLGEMINILKSEVTYSWLFLSLVIGLSSHLSRTIRWQMLIEPIDKQPGLFNTFFAVMIGYLANLVIPRMGEISRCAVLRRYEKISFSRLVGTVVTERILDLVMLFISLALMVLVQYSVFKELIQDQIKISSIRAFFSSTWFLLIFFFAIGLLFVFRKNIMKSKLFFKIKGLWYKFKEGLLSYRQVRNKPMFFMHTVLIFVLYFLMIYVCFFCFPFTRDLGLGAGLAVFVLGNFGMVAPVQGGTGPWHFMVISTLLFFGVQAPQAAAFALLVHGALNGMIVVIGLLALIILPIINKTPKEVKNTPEIVGHIKQGSF